MSAWFWKDGSPVVRAGQPERAGLERGDLLLIREVESPWVRGEFRAVLVEKPLSPGDGRWWGDLFVRPVAPRSEIPWRVAPSDAYLLGEGIYLTREDQRTLLEPVRPEGAERAA